jgi:dipeptidase E
VSAADVRAARRVVAIGGGGFTMGFAHELDTGVLALTESERPHVLFVPTASGDSGDHIARFYAAFARRTEASHVGLFHRTVDDLAGLCCAQDVIYVGGGNTANMLAVWRTHGFDRALRAAYEAGVVIAGISAGAVCWFEDAVTDSFGPPLRPLGAGLGWLPGPLVPHYDSEPGRRPALHQLVVDGVWPSGLAVDDGAALVFVDEQLTEVWSARARAAAYRVTVKDGYASEHRLDTERPPRLVPA